MPDLCDVLVIGGGPAGSTAAALLAERGHDVIIAERDEHPRFHIGESLLPANMPLLERLGVADAVKEIGTFKPGAEFIDDKTGKRVAFPFAQSLNRSMTRAYQVPRAEFDRILFENACSRGARGLQRTRVTDVTPARPGERATVTALCDGTPRVFAPRYVLDATGRDALMATKLGLKRANKRNSTAALFAHWRGAQMQLGEEPGYISIHLVGDGWIWMIPLPGGVMSIGFVGDATAFQGRSGTVESLYLDRLYRAPTVAARLRGAERLTGVTGTGNYSYRSTTSHGEGWLSIGDAFAFLDPVFSSGVLLAMTAGDMGADVAQAALADSRAGAAAAARMERRVVRAMDTLGWLVYRINQPVLRFMFMSPSNRFRMRDGLIAMLAGNLTIDWRLRIPVLAFKAAYYGLSIGHRFGVLEREAGLELQPAE